MAQYPDYLKRALVPNGCRRAPWHDYRSRSIYMITLNTAPEIPSLSVLKGIPGDHDWPPVTDLTEIGKIIASNISVLKQKFPFVKILRRVIMPEHLHFVIFVEKDTEIHLGEIIRHLKSNCTRQYHQMLTERLQRNDLEMQPLFEEGYHDRILMKRGQLQKMLDYVSDNPRRRLLRMANPGFHRRGRIRMSNGEELEIYGNIDLLCDPDIEPVKISRKYSPEVRRAKKICWKRNVENCGVLISPFISQNEKKVLNWAMDNGGRLIYIIDGGIGERFTPKGKLHELCSQGRLLIIGAYPFSHTKTAISRARCQSMNQLAVDIAEGKFQRI